MDTFNYIHSKGLFINDVTSSNIAIGNSKENLNKVFVFDLATSVAISGEFTPKDDLLSLGLVLLDLNGVKLSNENDIDADSDQMIQSLLLKWNDNYVKVSCTFDRIFIF